MVSLIFAEKATGMNIKDYRLNSTEEPTDEMLQELMEGVAVQARASTRRVQAALNRRMEEVREKIAAMNVNRFKHRNVRSRH